MGFFAGFIADKAYPVNHFHSSLIAKSSGNRVYSGWGIGFYQDGVPYLFKKSNHPARDTRLKNLFDTVTTKAMIFHAREATIGDSREANNHPFRWGSWLGAHIGTISDFRKIKSRINKTLPQNLINSIKGNTDSEYLFYSFLSEMKGAGFIKKGDLSAQDAQRSLKETVKLIKEYNESLKSPGESSLNSIYTTGNFIIALRRGSPVYYTINSTRKFISKENYKFGIISSIPLNDEDEWETLPDNSVISIDDNYEVNITAL